MGFGAAISSGFRNYVGFSGRATRSEFWWWILFINLVSLVLYIIDSAAGLHITQNVDWNIDMNGTPQIITVPGMPLLSQLWSLAVLLPTIAMTMRRYHDAGHSGWWVLWNFLLTFVCCAGAIIALVFALQRSQGDNKYGPAPAA